MLALWKNTAVVLAAAGIAACSSSVGGETGTGGGGTASGTGGSGTASGTGGGPASSAAAFAVPPLPGKHQWQGQQHELLTATYVPCTGRIALAVSQRAVCYAGVNGALRCAGAIYDHAYGAAFTDVGETDVDQILLSPTFNAEDHNAICVRTAAGAVRCMGNANDHGELGTGDTAPTSTFQPWGSVSGVTALVTGTWDALCALTGGGDAYCVGYGFGGSVAQEASGASALWIDTFGMLQVDDPSVLRMPNSGRTDCQITPSGMTCLVPPLTAPMTFGAAGDVVDGTYSLQGVKDGMPLYDARVCWLNGAGEVRCRSVSMGPDPMPVWSPEEQIFTQGTVLALAGSAYTTSLCAVYADGSIACRGANEGGKLGVASPDFLDTDTIVAPPGSIDVSCTP